MRKVEALRSGRYKVRFRIGGKQTSESFDLKRDATDFAKALDAVGPEDALHRLYAGEQSESVPTLDAVADEHITHLEASDGHRVKMARLWARTWGPRIGGRRADQITRDHLVAAFADLARNGKSPGVGYRPKSLTNQRGLLHGVLSRAVEDGHLLKHPGLKLKLPMTVTDATADGEDVDDTADMVCLSPAEFDILLAASSEHYRAMIRFMIGTGCRWGEVVELRKRDFALDDVSTVTIRRALKWSPDGKFVIGPPKTKRSRRTIVLPPELVTDLRFVLGGRQAGDLVFTAPRGGRVSHRTFWSDQWRPAIWRAQHCPVHTDADCRCGTAHPKRCTVHDSPPPPCGCAGTLGTGPRIHDLRHSHASWLLARGVPIHIVSARLGHESIKTTVDVYGHLLPDAQQAAADAASLAFSSTRVIG